MDIVGPLPKSRSGKRYILVICDYATRYLEAIALKDITAETVAEELISVFARVGIPEEILTDQGTNFTSEMLKQLYQLLHVKAIRTSPYHPQTDGLVERFNSTLKGMLRKFVRERGKDWDKLLPYLLFAYREVPQASTGFSPFELLYCREVRGPLDVLEEAWEEGDGTSMSIVSHVVQIREMMEKMKDVVHENLEQVRNRQKRWYDQHARLQEFSVGDFVGVLIPVQSNKLFAQWQGPFEVVKKLGMVTYQVDTLKRVNRYRTYHVNLLKWWELPDSTTGFMEEVLDDGNTDTILCWKGKEDGRTDLKYGNELTPTRRKDVEELVREKFSDVFA